MRSLQLGIKQGKLTMRSGNLAIHGKLAMQKNLLAVRQVKLNFRIGCFVQMIIVLRTRLLACVDLNLIADLRNGLNGNRGETVTIEILVLDLVIYLEATEKVRSETCFGKECVETIETTEEGTELAVLIRLRTYASVRKFNRSFTFTVN